MNEEMEVKEEDIEACKGRVLMYPRHTSQSHRVNRPVPIAGIRGGQGTVGRREMSVNEAILHDVNTHTRPDVTISTSSRTVPYRIVQHRPTMDEPNEAPESSKLRSTFSHSRAPCSLPCPSPYRTEARESVVAGRNATPTFPCMMATLRYP